MTRNERIVKNFRDYDSFLTKLNSRETKIALSLKMMYSIHMENNSSVQDFFVCIKQFIRFLLKFFLIPFISYQLQGKKKSSYVILSNSKIESYIADRLNLSLINLKIRVMPHLKIVYIYKELFSILYCFCFKSNLNKKYIFLLAHRLIDYLLVYHTVDIEVIEGLLIENDRDPKNLALIHRLREKKRKTIKYDNWLIDPVNHNDIYCEYYFYPSFYHKNIIASFPSNAKLKYLKGGFFDWDRLNSYKVVKPIKRVIYFTQFGIEMSQHKRYINDIAEVLKNLDDEYQFIIKIHPREKISKYREVIEDIYPIEFIGICDDVYQLIAEAEFCFSVFSTISLEAKHIVKNSYFINYDYQNFEILDYDKLDFDLIKNRETLQKILGKDYSPVPIVEFVEKNNCSFPYSIEIMEKILRNDK